MKKKNRYMKKKFINYRVKIIKNTIFLRMNLEKMINIMKGFLKSKNFFLQFPVCDGDNFVLKRINFFKV